MTIWRGRRCRAAAAWAQRAGAVGLFAVAVLAVPAVAGAGEGAVVDPRDVGTRLDLKTLTHTQDGRSIVYTAQTYGPFSDQMAGFKWGVDRDRDENFDLFVFTEWRDGKLVGGVKDADGRQIAPAAVSRPGPTAIRVSFPTDVLGDVAAYRYAVTAEGVPGDRDLAPNSGLVQHRLGAITAPAQDSRTAASSAPTAPIPAPQVAGAPAPVSPAKTSLPRTGSGDRALLPWSGVALVAGGAFVALGARRVRQEITGGIR